MKKVIAIKQDNVPHCPVCNHTLDCHTGTNHNHLPKNNDISICINCISTLIYVVTKDCFDVRIPTEEEQKELDANEEIIRIKRIMMAVKSEK